MQSLWKRRRRLVSWLVDKRAISSQATHGLDEAVASDKNVHVNRPFEIPPALETRLHSTLKEFQLDQITAYHFKLSKLSESFEKGVLPTPPSYDSKKSLGYIAFRMIPNYSAVRCGLGRLFESMQHTPTEDGPIQVLDFGSGPGTATWALYDALGEDHDIETTLVDSSLPMIDAARKLAGDDFQVNFCRDLFELTRSSTLYSAARYDFVLASFSLSELPSNQAREVAVDVLWSFVKPNGIMLVVEKGSRFGSQLVGSARHQVLQGGSRYDLTGFYRKTRNYDVDDDEPASDQVHGARVLAPCGHNGMCPFFEGSKPVDSRHSVEGKYCSFTQSTHRLLSGTRAPKGKPHSVTFSYVAMQKTAKQQADAWNAGDQLRILQKPKKNVRHVVLDLCHPSGKVVKETVPHSHGDRYKRARKSLWGDLFDHIPKQAPTSDESSEQVST